MARRRGKGEGTITQRVDGRWMARVDMGRSEDGLRLRKVAYGATRAAAATKLNALLGRSVSGELLTTSTPTVASWLKDWYATHRDDWAPSTQRVYRIAIQQWIAPALGAVRLEQLKPAAIQRWVNGATEDRPRERVVIAHTVLRSALGWAMTQRVLTYNAAALVKVPRPTRPQMAPLSADQARQLLTVARGHRLEALITITLMLGLRIGEASGLTWADIDLSAGSARIRQQVQFLGKGIVSLAPLKTSNSRRTLTMPLLVVEALKAHRKRQMEERLRAGDTWQKAADLVFTTTSGRPLNPGVIRSALRDLMNLAGLDAIKFHGLRHTAATLLLTDGAPLFDVSRILGHAQISTTSDIYGHLVPEMTASAAARMDMVLASKTNRS